MALRDYMQELIRTQTRVDDEHEDNGIVKIIVVPDNSFSSIRYDCIDDLGNRSISELSSISGSRGMKNSETSHNWDGECEDCRDESNRIMLDGFRRRQRFLRETLSPNIKSSRTNTESTLQFSPSPIVTQRSPNHSEQRQGDSQRDRMRRLKKNLRMQEDASLTLL
mmetsp:Transcript_13679/g.34398  ORF Transcript_13679/g.34398 Transcript_13679/m.34398 type:complete len:166 (+) Transcript_13679:267-764(+)|eukprot:CAMPEP_0116101202 /NCGR_PEP_ID=MMETSP0327-20121206/12687_1 /TAXON_ID=44447 /ORGANISM="Pseudo-nitzschia delicatissima, Strain B596" /LENGTH=165 /DNA_ID=CAMNT_0003593153 /DNA_START=187 /DNA_END=684 /DNA_ORIENTATION=+